MARVSAHAQVEPGGARANAAAEAVHAGPAALVRQRRTPTAHDIVRRAHAADCGRHVGAGRGAWVPSLSREVRPQPCAGGVAALRCRLHQPQNVVLLSSRQPQRAQAGKLRLWPVL
eukprot:364709-Chlamydomonas_euryale.AAC.7